LISIMKSGSRNVQNYKTFRFLETMGGFND
jgi:hypothetical protein